MRQPFFTPQVYPPKGPYSQAILTSGKQLWVAGQTPLDPKTGELVLGDFETQAVQVFENLKTIVENAGGNLSKVIKVQVYLKDNVHFQQLNEIYVRYFPEPLPARTTIQSDLRGILIEVDAVIALD